MNIMMLLEMAASGCPERIAFVDPEMDVSISYQELFDAAGNMAAILRGSDAGRLAMLDISNIGIPIGLFASGWAGIPYVPLNYRLTDPEIDSLIDRITPAYLVTEPERVAGFRDREGVQVSSRTDFVGQARVSGEAPDPWSMDPEDTAVLLFTSGTTGAPKAAVLRQKHLVSYILGSVEFMGADEEEAALVCVPPYHIAGIAAVLSSVYSGRRVVQLANFTAEKWVQIAHDEKITTAFVVPTMLSRIVEELDGAKNADMPHLQSLSYGGGKMPLSVIQRAMELFPGTDFTNAYGLTETSSTITVLGPDEHRLAAASDEESIRRRLVSVGVPLPGIELEIRDEEGSVQPVGERGEIYVRGEQVSGEYEGRG
ncbi:MAG TPA: AMP-dependent synthetase, partial [Gammaproteobacteria bacterium]|nr:AMP-dependent synthetase [Gammaproteobacteria bacterium]